MFPKGFSPNTCQFLLSAPSRRAIPSEMVPEIAFWGRSNVGKSSLLNAMMGRRDLARTSKTPGRTQALQFYYVLPHVRFVDLPGYGYAKVPRSLQYQWNGVVSYYLCNRAVLRKIFLLVDGRHPFQAADKEAILFLKDIKAPYEILFTKVDSISKSQRLALGIPGPIQVSSKTKEGIKEVWEGIISLCGIE